MGKNKRKPGIKARGRYTKKQLKSALRAVSEAAWGFKKIAEIASRSKIKPDTEPVKLYSIF